MIGLRRTRGVSADTWQILLTNNTLNATLLIGVVYIALTFLGREQTAGPFSRADLYGTG
jgi:hypothetical protein